MSTSANYTPRSNKSPAPRCGDCGCKEGEIHMVTCDMEVCRFCGNQALSCPCGPEKWRGPRIPYIAWTQRCRRCGEEWPDFFLVSNEEWMRVVEPEHRGAILCKKCYRKIKRIMKKNGAEFNLDE